MPFYTYKLSFTSFCDVSMVAANRIVGIVGQSKSISPMLQRCVLVKGRPNCAAKTVRSQGKSGGETEKQTPNRCCVACWPAFRITALHSNAQVQASRYWRLPTRGLLIAGLPFSLRVGRSLDQSGHFVRTGRSVPLPAPSNRSVASTDSSTTKKPYALPRERQVNCWRSQLHSPVHSQIVL